MRTPPSTPEESAATSEAVQLTVLIVEDEAPIAEALEFLVEDAGYTALVAHHGKAGLELALQRRPALIFSDLMMPQMGGREFIRALRAELNSSAPPVVLMTAADVSFAQDADADSILKKPFDIATVEALIRRLLDSH